MKNGYVYILTNSSMPDLIKIGRTERDSNQRAKELSSTSVPTPFKVAFEIFSPNFDELEKTIHAELDDFRVSNNREFFRYPLNKAIDLLQKLNGNHSKDVNFEAVDIMNELVAKYPNHLKNNIVSVRIVQPESRVWLEITYEDVSTDGEIVNQTIKREDLAYIIKGENHEKYEKYFNPNDNVQVNARKYIEEFDVQSIYMTSDLFKEELAKNYWTNNGLQ